MNREPAWLVPTATALDRSVEAHGERLAAAVLEADRAAVRVCPLCGLVNDHRADCPRVWIP